MNTFSLDDLPAVSRLPFMILFSEMIQRAVPYETNAGHLYLCKFNHSIFGLSFDEHRQIQLDLVLPVSYYVDRPLGRISHIHRHRIATLSDISLIDLFSLRIAQLSEKDPSHVP